MDLNWAEIFAWPSLLKCFIVGGLLCVIGQILIDKTKLTPARILVIFFYYWCCFGWSWYLSISC